MLRIPREHELRGFHDVSWDRPSPLGVCGTVRRLAYDLCKSCVEITVR